MKRRQFLKILGFAPAVAVLPVLAETDKEPLNFSGAKTLTHNSSPINIPNGSYHDITGTTTITEINQDLISSEGWKLAENQSNPDWSKYTRWEIKRPSKDVKFHGDFEIEIIE